MVVWIDFFSFGKDFLRLCFFLSIMSCNNFDPRFRNDMPLGTIRGN